MKKEFWFNEAYIYKTGRKGKEIDNRFADDYEEWKTTLRGWAHHFRMKFHCRWITLRAHLRYYFPLVFGSPTQEDCVYELYRKPIKSKIVGIYKIK